MDIRLIPTLKDNYTYLIIDDSKSKALIIDPGQALPVLKILDEEKLEPQAVWVTHHHSDHTGGIAELVERFETLPVLCSSKSKAHIPWHTKTVQEEDVIESVGFKAKVLELPGHAEDHLGFYFEASGDLFSGDVLFGASCGAVFSNTYSEMYLSLCRIKDLPLATRIWCGHEYTANNLSWAASVLGEAALRQRIATFKTPSVPLLLSEELTTNPFLRLSSPKVQQYTNTDKEVETFKALRLLKDRASK